MISCSIIFLIYLSFIVYRYNDNLGNKTTEITAVGYYWPIPVIVITIMTKNNPCGIFLSFDNLLIYVVIEIEIEIVMLYRQRDGRYYCGCLLLADTCDRDPDPGGHLRQLSRLPRHLHQQVRRRFPTLAAKDFCYIL